MESIYNSLVSGDEITAKAQLKTFLKQTFELVISDLSFQQSEVSLNSFKGSFYSNDQKYFFKTHIEIGGEIREYAGANLLEEAGYSMILPAFTCEDSGRELLIYPYVEDVSLFDLVKRFNEGDESVFSEDLQAAQIESDERLFQLYQKTFEVSDSILFPDVQQLFYLRLNGQRMNLFYRGQSRVFGNESISFERLEDLDWVVNGRALGKLKDWIELALKVLSPEEILSFSVVGHGDAHNGNVFFGDEGLRYFDPAYAGRMDPFLDLTKPLFHNAFARWMYFPEQVEAEFEVGFEIVGDRIEVSHNYKSSDMEQFFFDSKMQNVLNPLLDFLLEKEVLPVDWEARLRSSLMCCPLLTVNLFDENKYSSQMSVLGFAMVAEMASLDFNLYLK
jgi:hypothetical protein